MGTEETFRQELTGFRDRVVDRWGRSATVGLKTALASRVIPRRPRAMVWWHVRVSIRPIATDRSLSCTSRFGLAFASVLDIASNEDEQPNDRDSRETEPLDGIGQMGAIIEFRKLFSNQPTLCWRHRRC